MDFKNYLIIGLGFLGWIWAITQYFLNRRNQRNDKALEKRFDVYSAFLLKMDEINQSMRTDPKMIYGITNEFMARVSNGDEIEINKALLDFNTELIEYTKKSLQPTMILNQELNKLKLVCSDAMLPKINKYKEVTAEHLDEFQIVLNNISSKNDLDLTAKELTNISHSERTLILTKLWQEIESMMRQEIGYHKN